MASPFAFWRVLLSSVAWVRVSGSSGAEPWRIFPEGGVPFERPGEIGPEAFVPEPGSSGHENMMYLNVTVPELTPFLVSGSDAVVIAPGGAYSHLAWSKEGTDIAAWLNSIGISAFLLKYRVPARPWLEFGQAPLVDAARAVRLVRSKAAELGLNAGRIGFLGFSAGGHLGAHLSTSTASDIYPPIDAADALSYLPDFLMMVYPARLLEEDRRTLRVNVTRKHPPTFLAQAWDDDRHVETSIQYALELKTKGAPPSELHVYPAGGHGYGRCTIDTPVHHEVCTWPARAERWMRHLVHPVEAIV
eukprot:TRINITY_DN103903_c0_g1_i1.p1 TRINITY_DN103903_c0_g1~~TRINITY_DN103903_c0_g1_i1.p1  ORF type:complete len:303 (-),score=47.29 TRINITY_DN103903_c0_g1_i1:10-918(-)